MGILSRSRAGSFCAASTTRCSASREWKRSPSPRPSSVTSNFSPLTSLVPGSWINANFNVWIGAPEDNRSWDYLYHARNFYAAGAANASEAQRKLAFEEILIAEGSDWNWWYGPEHHSANDRDFDELYRKHLSNVYQALGASPPDYLAQPIFGAGARPAFTSADRVHPSPHYRRDGPLLRMDGRGRLHRRPSLRRHAWQEFLLDAVYAGIDEEYVYGRLDFVDEVPEGDFEIVVNLESWASGEHRPRRSVRLDAAVNGRKLQTWKIGIAEEAEGLASSYHPGSTASKLALGRNFEFKVPLAWLLAAPRAVKAPAGKTSEPVATRLKLRFSLWQNRLPVDALPLEGWIELELLSEGDLMSMA